jgi:transcriptional regulator with XRE-family HTH domain
MKIEMSNETILKELGSRVKQLRLSKNQDQKAFAYEAGVPLRTLSRLENGGSTSFEVVIKVMRALGLLNRLDMLIPSSIEISPVQKARAPKSVKTRRRATGKRTVKAATRKKMWKGFPKPVTFDGGED